MKGWVTVDVQQVIETIKPYGYLKVLDKQELVVEMETGKEHEKLTGALEQEFGEQAFLERL